MSARISAFLHMEEEPTARVRFAGGTSTLCLHVSETSGNEVFLFLSDVQLIALHRLLSGQVAAMKKPQGAQS